MNVSTVDGSQTTTTYAYSGDGDRVSQTMDSVETTYILDSTTPLTMVLAETTGQDSIYYLHGLDLVAQSDGTTTDYLAYDGLGSVRQVLDDVGAPLLTQTFDPYGNLLARGGTGESSFGFTGEQVDANGLVYLRARYYQPGMGRFLNMDPSRLEMNPYQYGFSNPTNYADPSGLIPVECMVDPDGELCLNARRDPIEVYLELYARQLWDPEYIGGVPPETQLAAEHAYVHLLLDPQYFLVLYANAEYCNEEWRYLDTFAQYSTLHTYAENLVLYYAPNQEIAYLLHANELRSWLAQGSGEVTVLRLDSWTDLCVQ